MNSDKELTYPYMQDNHIGLSEEDLAEFTVHCGLFAKISLRQPHEYLGCFVGWKRGVEIDLLCHKFRIKLYTLYRILG